MTSAFIGIVFVAVIGGAAESISAISKGMKNKVDRTMGNSLDSSIQIALFVAPILVILSFFIGPEPLVLKFNRAEVGSLFMDVLLTTILAGDGNRTGTKVFS